MVYLTFNDNPSGIFSSQVIDVVRFLNNHYNIKVRLVSFISIRNYFHNRNLIRKECPEAIVVPMIPMLRNWELNKWMLCLICILINPKTIIARSVFAANLAIQLRNMGFIKKVCYDGRGAIKAECMEYNVLNDNVLLAQIGDIEKRAIIESDCRIAVSCSLIEYWSTEYGFSELNDNSRVIPCTFSSDYVLQELTNSDSQTVRKELGFDDDDIVLAYSGSTAGWQSFKLLIEYISCQFESNSKVKILFLSKEDAQINQLKKQYPERVKIKWVNPQNVNRYLHACDYGLLVREQSITNKVAAPTKFAEYLAAGMPVIISENLGDYSYFVKHNNCGIIYVPASHRVDDLHKISLTEKENLQKLAFTHFSKQSVMNHFGVILSSLYLDIH